MTALSIPLTKGQVAIVDAADFARVSGYAAWYAQSRSDGKGWYACARVPGSGRGGKKVLMHKLLIQDAARVDHWDGDGLNNRRANLRPCTQSENCANARKQAATSSRFKGVYLDRHRQRWAAEITHQRRKIHLGRFVSEQAAAQAYNLAALELFGEFAKLNEIGD
jgi:AP2 domain/HNH endonuclease